MKGVHPDSVIQVRVVVTNAGGDELEYRDSFAPPPFAQVHPYASVKATLAEAIRGNPKIVPDGYRITKIQIAIWPPGKFPDFSKAHLN